MSKTMLNLDSQKLLKIVTEREKVLLKDNDLSSIPITEAREIFLKLLAPEKPLKTIPTTVLDTYFSYDSVKIPLRIYKPSKDDMLLPALIFFHGGGFAFGDLDFIDYSCRLLSKIVECMVISVAYRKAPEHKFPTAHQDCYEAAKYVQQNAKQLGCNGMLAVGGESAGANLAIGVTYMAKKNQEMKITAQILYYPWVNLKNDLPSNKKFATGYLLETPALHWMSGQYLATAKEIKDPLISPLLQKDCSDLPPALILAAECDPIHDDAKMYFDKLIQANVSAQYVEFGGVTHGFFALPWIFEASHFSFSMVRETLHRYFYDS